MLSGPAGNRGPILEWEGTRYRVELQPAPNRSVCATCSETSPRPYVTAADTMLLAAKTFESGTPSRQALTAAAEAIAGAAEATHCADHDEWATRDLSDRCRTTVAAVARAAKSGDTKNAQRLAPRLAPAVGRAARARAARAGLCGWCSGSRTTRSMSRGRCREPAQFRASTCPASDGGRVAAAGCRRGPDPRLASHRLDPRPRRRAGAARARPHQQPAAVDASVAQRRRSAGPHRGGGADGAGLLTADRSPVHRRGRAARPRAAGRLRVGGRRRGPRRALRMPAVRRHVVRPGPPDRACRARPRRCRPPNCFAADSGPRRGRRGSTPGARPVSRGSAVSVCRLPGRRRSTTFAGRWHTGVLATGFPI